MKKFLITMLGFAILITSIPVFASFPDINDEHWAYDNVMSMTEAGYILGFPDGTFRPEDEVTHLQSLILLSRVLGVDDDSNEAVADWAAEKYAEVLAPFDTFAERYVAFLLYNDVIFANELEMYVSDQPLPRYRAAILLTKLMGGELEVRRQVVVVSTFNDVALIPPAARGFTQFVFENGLMQGVGVAPSGTPIFDPVSYVTRAQMATMLSNLLPVMERASVVGDVYSIDIENDEISVTLADDSTHYSEILDNSVIYIDGVLASLAQVEIGNSVQITYINQNARIIDVSTVLLDDNGNNGDEPPIINNVEREYVFSSLGTRAGVIEITVQNIDAQGQPRQYLLAASTRVTLNGGAALPGDIRAGYLVYLAINPQQGIVNEIRAYSPAGAASGTLTRADADGLEITLTNGDVRAFALAQNRNIGVTRNNAPSSVANLAIGDTVTLTLEHNRVTRVEARSVDVRMEGVIEEVVISRTPTITVQVGGEYLTFYVSNNVVITIDGMEDGALRDLHPGARIRFEAESRTIISIETTAAVEVNVVEGIVRAVDAHFSYISLEVRDSATNQVSTQAVLVMNNANITRAGTTGLRRFGDIQVGQRIIVHGSNITGSFRADTILIISD